MPAIFFINALCYAESKACAVHKIHWLRSNVSSEEFMSQVIMELRKRGVQVELDPEQKREANLQYRYDVPEVKRIKFLLNNVVSYEIRDEVIDKIFSRYISDEEGFCKEFYMTKQQILDIHRLKHYSIGFHSYSHLPLAQLEQKEWKKELFLGRKVIEDIIKDNLLSISYPYGSKSAVSLELANYCEFLGLNLGFTMERSFNRTLSKPLLFARIDTNDAPGGASPLFRIEQEKCYLMSESMSMARKVYFEEK